MTRTAAARLAGIVFLLYIATGVTSMVLFSRAAGGGGAAAKLASLAQHVTLVQVTVILTLLQFVYALVLGMTLYTLTKDQDHDVAMLAFSCRVSEGVISAVSAIRTLALLSVATTAAGAVVADAAAAKAVGAVLLDMGGWTGLIAATCFAIGSTLYSWLFLRARSIPVPLAWLGLCASILLVVLLPAQLAGFARGSVTNFMWLPMLVFEVGLAFWLLTKGMSITERPPHPGDGAQP